ncbi:MAG: hypothetical protein KDA96_04460 [Planctomycetaceae bacterium]|nr:hypothetical protein [Planctomycetaceae bacterium]
MFQVRSCSALLLMCLVPAALSFAASSPLWAQDDSAESSGGGQQTQAAAGAVVIPAATAAPQVERVDAVTVTPRANVPAGVPIQIESESIPNPVNSVPRIIAIANDERQASGPQLGVVVFPGPCHFPLNSTSRAGTVMLQDALVILEGMQIAIHADGRYDLDFIAERPRRTVTVRLAFEVVSPGGEQIAVLTVPKFQIPASAESGNLVAVRHGGYSRGLHLAIQAGRIHQAAVPHGDGQNRLDLFVARNGTAVFNSP